jgi:single-strand DNA-binding protein
MPDLRMPGINHVALDGRLTRDPELKYTSGGQPYCKLGIANDERYKDKAGQVQKRTTFVSATVWGQSAEYAGKNLRKGDAVYLEGRLTLNEWEDKQTGQKRSIIEINAQRVTPLSWPAKDGEQERASAPQQGATEDEVPLDDIPF